MIVWAAMFNPCIYESSYGIISLHATRGGARLAMRENKLAHQKEQKRISRKFKEKYMPSSYEKWFVVKVNVRNP